MALRMASIGRGLAARQATCAAPYALQPVRYSSAATIAPKSDCRPPTGILLMNMGGPQNLKDVHGFLLRLFSDKDIINLPFQKYLGPFIAWRRTPSIQKQYAAIGGGSPIRCWTEAQGAGMVRLLDKLCPETAPHKFYIGFRYAEPLTGGALKQMQADGVRRAVAFSQYPQYSCTTTGSSLNDLRRQLVSTGMSENMEWSVIDRWPAHPIFVKAVVTNILKALEEFPTERRSETVLLFSAHSLPLKTVDKGDTYPHEVAATTHAVMEELEARGVRLSHRLIWQSKVGPLPWLGPQTKQTIENYHKQGEKTLLVVPIAFTSDHIETLFELDLEYGKHLLSEINDPEFMLRRSESLNDSPVFIEAMADLVAQHLRSGHRASRQLPLRCPACVSEDCSITKRIFVPTV